MTYTTAFLLGLIQALGEFLPISSSAHLALFPFFSGAVYQGLTFDVLLHFATLIAVPGRRPGCRRRLRRPERWCKRKQRR